MLFALYWVYVTLMAFNTTLYTYFGGDSIPLGARCVWRFEGWPACLDLLAHSLPGTANLSDALGGGSYGSEADDADVELHLRDLTVRCVGWPAWKAPCYRDHGLTSRHPPPPPSPHTLCDSAKASATTYRVAKVRWPAWKCVLFAGEASHPGTPTLASYRVAKVRVSCLPAWALASPPPFQPPSHQPSPRLPRLHTFPPHPHSSPTPHPAPLGFTHTPHHAPPVALRRAA